MDVHRRVFSRIVIVAILATGGLFAAQPPASRQVEWPYYGGDPGGMKYSTLTDIDATKVQRLQVAWEWKHWETPLAEFGTTPGFFEATPLMIDGVLYVTTPYNSIAALDAETGRELWRFDGEAYKLGQILSGSGWKLRGTAFWRDGNKLRVFLNSRHRMFSLEAEDGRPVRSFGNAGVVSLTDGLARIADIKHATQSSPPVVYRDLVIVGSQIPDRVQVADPVGYVQAFNARTGKRAWTFAVTPQSPTDPGAETWANDSWRKNGHANVWAPMALDAARGLLYLPTSTPSSDYYGGGRPGANLFAESLVCLDAATGKMKWHFQTVHHGLWDYDNPAQPNLITITVNGRRIDAVAQITKQGFTYVFDRVTGQPVWPIVERPVPIETNVPGEIPFPTQPFPTRPPPFTDQGVSLDDANDLTPAIKAMAQQQMKKFRLGPLFTPPSLEGTLQRPAQGGGGNWGGAAFDPENGVPVRASDARSRFEPGGEERRIRSTRGGRVLRQVRTGWRRRQCERPSAHGSALRGVHGGGPEQGRDCVAGTARRRDPGAAQQRPPAWRDLAQSPRFAQQSRRGAGHQERSRVHRRRRQLLLRLRYQDRQRSLADESPVSEYRQPDDVSHSLRTPVHRRRQRHGGR